MIKNGARNTKKGGSLLCSRTEIKYQFIKEQEKTYSVKILCQLLQVSRSAYYHWQALSPVIEDKDKSLKNKLKELFEYSRKTYGSRRLAKELIKSGYEIGRFKIRRLMEELKLQVRYPKRFKATTDSKHRFEVLLNKLNRRFKVMQPNEVWTADISYVWTLEGFVYVAVIMI